MSYFCLTSNSCPNFIIQPPKKRDMKQGLPKELKNTTTCHHTVNEKRETEILEQISANFFTLF